MGVSTGTICPFPYTTANASNPTPQSVSECTVTYAQAIGPVYEVFRALLLAVSSIGIFVLAYRVYTFYVQSVRHNKLTTSKLLNHPMFRMMVVGVAYCTSCLITSADMFAFNGLYPMEFFAIMDEITASLALSVAVLTVDLYHQLTSLKTKRPRLTIIARNVTLSAIWINFIGFIILGIVDSPRFHLYEGLKCLFASAIIGGFIVSSTYYVRSLVQMLRQGLELQADRTRGEQQIAILQRKHFRFNLVAGFACVALAATGVLALTVEDWSWTLKIEAMPDPAQLALRGAFLLYTILLLYILRVPKWDSSSTHNRSGGGENKSSSTGQGPTTAESSRGFIPSIKQVAPVNSVIAPQVL